MAIKIKKVNTNYSHCLMILNNPREFYMRLNTGVVNNFNWSDGKPIIVNLN